MTDVKQDAQPGPAEWQVDAACDTFGIAKTNWFDRSKMTDALRAASVSTHGEQKRLLKDGPVLRLVRLRFFRDLIQSERVKVYNTFGIDKNDLPDPLTLGIEQQIFDQLFVRRAAPSNPVVSDALRVFASWSIDVATIGELADLEVRMNAVGVTLDQVGQWSALSVNPRSEAENAPRP